MTDLDALLGLAREAAEVHPGPWSAHAFGRAGDEEPTSVVVLPANQPWDHSALVGGEADAVCWAEAGYAGSVTASFIAALDPETVIALIEAARRADTVGA